MLKGPFCNIFYSRQNTRKKAVALELVDLYTIAFESLLSEELSNGKIDFIVIDLNHERYDILGTQGKEQILDYFRKKYHVDVYNETEESMKKVGLANKYGDIEADGKEGILLGINESRVSSDRTIIDGYWLRSGVSGRGAIIYLDSNEGLWKINNMVWTWYA